MDNQNIPADPDRDAIRAWREANWGKQPAAGRGGSRPGSGRPKGSKTKGPESLQAMVARHKRELIRVLSRQRRELARLRDRKGGNSK